MKLFIAAFSLLICFCEIHAHDYNCEKLKSDETTRKGYFATIVFKEEKSFQVVQGIAEFNGEPTENVFVEVFANKNPNRITGCKTGDNGRFSFPNLKKGKYTIRLSKDGGFQITEIKIKISPGNKNKKEIIGVIQVGV